MLCITDYLFTMYVFKAVFNCRSESLNNTKMILKSLICNKVSVPSLYVAGLKISVRS